MSGVYVIDNHILVWGVRQKAHDSQLHMIQRTLAFVELCAHREDRVIVPAPVLAEFLTVYDTPAQNVIRAVIEQNFMVVPFDTSAAAHTARIWKANRDSGLINALRDELPDYKRIKITIDHQIIGTAMARNADMLYTEDNALLRFAGPHLNVARLPEPIQPSFPLHITPRETDTETE